MDFPLSTEKISALEDTLLNRSGDVPLARRFRALFTLKAIPGTQSIDVIAKGFSDDSALLKHELAYVLGQKKDPAALPILTRVLEDLAEDPMVRHEAAEAMGAISSAASVPVLTKYISDPERAVRETCEIALAKIAYDRAPQDAPPAGAIDYATVDPAPASGLMRGASGVGSDEDVPALRAALLDTARPLFERYRAMFALRNIGTDTAVDALAAGFGDSSALFKHEIAFVFGQMAPPRATPALLRVLEDAREADMVRHEAAEALGSIATDDVLPHLRTWAKRDDAPRVVRESCVVALDMWEYQNSGQFQYADGLGSHSP